VAEVKTALTDDTAAYQKYVAMYDFTARNFDELSLKAGEHVMVNIIHPSVCCLSECIHPHTTVLWPFFWDHMNETVPENLVDFVMQGKITEADTPTIRLGATASGLISDPPPSSSPAGCPSCHNPPTSSWLGTGTEFAGLHTQWCGFILNVYSVNIMQSINMLFF